MYLLRTYYLPGIAKAGKAALAFIDFFILALRMMTDQLSPLAIVTSNKVTASTDLQRLQVSPGGNQD